MENEKKQYPLKKTYLFTTDVLTISFSYTVRFGSGKRETEGEDIVMLLDGRGDIHPVMGAPETFDVICEGVAMICEYTEEISDESGVSGAGYFTKKLCIHRDACPIVLYVDGFRILEEDSWKDQSLNNYSIRVHPVNLKRHRDVL